MLVKKKDAVFYDFARRAGHDNLLADLTADWRDDIWLQKGLARYRVSADIARIARDVIVNL